MARKKKEPNRVDEMLDELLADCQSPEDILGVKWIQVVGQFRGISKP